MRNRSRRMSTERQLSRFVAFCDFAKALRLLDHANILLCVAYLFNAKRFSLSPSRTIVKICENTANKINNTFYARFGCANWAHLFAQTYFGIEQFMIYITNTY